MAQSNLLTVEEAIATALKNNYDIRLLKADSTIAAIDQAYYYGTFLPRVNASGSVVFNNNNQKQTLADGSKRASKNLRSDNIQSSLNLNWTLFDGFKMFITRDKLKEINTLNGMMLKDLVTNTVADVTNTYYNIVRQKQQVVAINEQMVLNEERLKLAEKKLGVGLGAKPELLQSKLDLNAQKVAKLNQLSLIEQIKVELNKLMNVADTTNYDVTDSIPFKQNITAGETVGTANSKNLQLHIIKQEKKLAEFTLKEIRSERFPTLTFNSAYNFSRLHNSNVINTFTPLINRNLGFNYGFTLNIPILNNFRNRRETKIAESEIAFKDLQYELQRQKIESGITKSFKNYLLQKSILELEEENIKLAKENVFISKERLRLGITTVLELRETQKSLEEVYNRLIAARYNAKLAETELLRLSGQLVD